MSISKVEIWQLEVRAEKTQVSRVGRVCPYVYLCFQCKAQLIFDLITISHKPYLIFSCCLLAPNPCCVTWFIESTTVKIQQIGQNGDDNPQFWNERSPCAPRRQRCLQGCFRGWVISNVVASGASAIKDRSYWLQQKDLSLFYEWIQAGFEILLTAILAHMERWIQKCVSLHRTC